MIRLTSRRECTRGSASYGLISSQPLGGPNVPGAGAAEVPHAAAVVSVQPA